MKNIGIVIALLLAALSINAVELPHGREPKNPHVEIHFAEGMV